MNIAMDVIYYYKYKFMYIIILITLELTAVFTDVKIRKLIIYNTSQLVMPITLYMLHNLYSYIVLICLLPYALLWHVLYTSQYRSRSNELWLVNIT